MDRCCLYTAVITSAFFLLSYTIMFLIIEYNNNIDSDD
jgi:hypothetical protein